MVTSCADLFYGKANTRGWGVQDGTWTYLVCDQSISDGGCLLFLICGVISEILWSSPPTGINHGGGNSLVFYLTCGEFRMQGDFKQSEFTHAGQD